MATIAHPVGLPSSEEVTAAEEALIKIFIENLESLPLERQHEIIADLRSNAAAHAESSNRRS